MAVDGPRHAIVRNWQHVFAKNLLDSHNRFRICDVCELRRVDEITNCPYASFTCTTPIIDLDETSLGDFHSSSGKAKFVGIRTTADRHNDCIDFECGPVTQLNRGSTACVRHMTRDADSSLDIDFLFLKTTHDNVGDI